MGRALPFVYLFVVLAALLPAAGFFDLYLLPWQSRSIFLDNPNLWRAMRDNPAAYLPFTRFSALPYGPLFYYPAGLWVFLLDRLHLLDMHAWTDFGAATTSMRYTALLKLPNLAVYLATAAVLRRTLPGRAGADAMRLWLFNPAVILGAFVMGQNDGWSILAVLGATLLAARVFEGTPVSVGGRPLPAAPLAMVLLGAGAAVKLHPLLFVPTFAYLLGRTWRGRMLLIIVAGVTFGLLIAPFAWDSFFREHALLSPQGKNILHYRLLGVPLFYPGYALALALPLATRERGLRPLLATLVSVHLLVFALSDWPPERAAWFIGALALAAAVSRAGLAAYVLTTIQTFVVAMELGNGLGAGALSLVSDRLNWQPGLEQAIDRLWSYDHLQTTGLWLGVAAWCLALAALLRPRRLPLLARPATVPAWVPPAALSLLPAYFAGAILYGSGGLTTGSPGEAAGAISGPATVEQRFVASAGSLSAIDVAVAGDDGAHPLHATLAPDGAPAGWPIAVGASGSDGYRRLSFPAIAESQARVYALRLDVPAGITLPTAQVPEVAYVAPATVDGGPVGTALDFRQHYTRDWSALGRDARRAFDAGAGVVAVIAAVLAAALFAVWRWAEVEPAPAQGERALARAAQTPRG